MLTVEGKPRCRYPRGKADDVSPLVFFCGLRTVHQTSTCPAGGSLETFSHVNLVTLPRNLAKTKTSQPTVWNARTDLSRCPYTSSSFYCSFHGHQGEIQFCSWVASGWGCSLTTKYRNTAKLAAVSCPQPCSFHKKLTHLRGAH